VVCLYLSERVIRISKANAMNFSNRIEKPITL
jgi:hypothetical protein